MTACQITFLEGQTLCESNSWPLGGRSPRTPGAPADPTSRPLRPLCCYSAFTVHPKTLPDSLHVLDVGIGPEHGC